MGHKFDKHGRRNRDEIHVPALAQMCGRCGKSAQNMEEHNALFHPEYRPGPPPTAVKLRRVADPTQQGLENYPDTAESGDSASIEAGRGSRARERSLKVWCCRRSADGSSVDSTS